MLNSVCLIGRLVKKIEVKELENHKVANFTLAVAREGKDNGTDFIDCTCWNKLAEISEKYLDKGSLICVKGKLQTKQYTDKENNFRKVVDVLCSSIYFLDTNKKRVASTPDYVNELFDPSNDENLNFDLQDYYASLEKIE